MNYLEEALNEAQKKLPGWAYAVIKKTLSEVGDEVPSEHAAYRIIKVAEEGIEISLDEGPLKGRYLINAPYADENEESGKGAKDELSGHEVSIAKLETDPLKKIVYGVVIDPYGENGAQADAHNDWIPPKSVEECAHDFMLGDAIIGMQHEKQAQAKLVESHIEQYPNRQDYLKAMRGEDHRVTRRKFGDDVVHSGSWIIGVQLGEAEWELYEKGEINAFSPGGTGFRVPLAEDEMPEVMFVDLIMPNVEEGI